MRMISALVQTVLVVLATVTVSNAEMMDRTALDTLTPVELNHGDTLRFTLRNGEVRTMTLEETSARVILTNLEEPGKAFHEGQTLYEMTCKVSIDSQPMVMRRFIPVQQSFYVPYIVNGMRIWFDGVCDIAGFLNDNHGGGMPRTDARLAVQDMTLPISPQPLHPWYPNPENYIDVAESYNANDVWMGPYQGADLHGGLDINMPIGTPLWAPIDFDTQFYFNSLAAGDNNNRWRAVRTWENGQRWVLQAHHIVRLLVPENTPLAQGTHFAEAAGVLTGNHAHSHFTFKIGPENDETLLDAWILFWQIFENNKERAGHIRAAMAPLSPARAGRPVTFNATGSRAGVTGNTLRCRWSFGDGGTSVGPRPRYVYVAPGIYAVTLTVSDGVALATQTQHITVDDPTEPITQPALLLESLDALTFRPRDVDTMDVYGCSPAFEPFTLQFTARPKSSPIPAAQTVLLRNGGRGSMVDPEVTVTFREGRDWLSVRPAGTELRVAADAAALPDRHGVYHADVEVDCPGALNSPQTFSVRLDVPSQRDRPAEKVTVDNTDEGCYATPWFWLAPQFHQHYPEHWRPGYRGDYLIARENAPGAFVRFTPDILAGRYTITLPEETPCPPTATAPAESRFALRVRHRHGTDTVWVEPMKSREAGTFEFDEGTAGYVEILAEDATGIVVADAVNWVRLPY